MTPTRIASASHPTTGPTSPLARRAGPSRPLDATDSPPRGWWMLVHQLPPEPPGLRMRIWRKLQALGALQIKGSVYVLPATEAAQEDLQWLLGEIRAAGAEASLWRASAVDGLSDDDLVLRFQATAAAEYEAIEAELAALRKSLRARQRGSSKTDAASKPLAKLRAQFHEIGQRDHFDAPRREIVGALIADLERTLQGPEMNTAPAGTLDRAVYQGRTWVTRAKVHVDRMASAWLIRRFIDPGAQFVFTTQARRLPVAGGLRFDMYDGEFTHEGELCTFEVLLRRFDLRARGLERIAQMVHDIDLKESRYDHAETAGVAASLDAIAEQAQDDATRIEMASTLLDGLLRRFARGTSG